MNLDRYELTSGNKLTAFEFVSRGPKGLIPKLVQFTPTNYKDLYNLAFGDKDADTGQINDIAISNNGDSEQVLATVVAAVIAFTDRYPNASIYATGSSKSRTRLYRMGITKYFQEAKSNFLIYGQIHSEWEPFVIGENYDAFIVQRKLLKFEI
ncbi:hypothetical protein [Mucilaginibacter sp.]|uniref:DUF6934 family protein n=1 Tax=Mucilaginibacter sp. TaxID=1882438 RepID=UPI003267061F